MEPHSSKKPIVAPKPVAERAIVKPAIVKNGPSESPKNNKPPLETDAVPTGSFLQMLAGIFRGGASEAEDDKHITSLKELLEKLLQEGEELHLQAEERILLQNMLRFSDMKVSDVMTPRTDIVAVESAISLEALKAAIAEQRHSRVPIMNGTLDKIEGFVHIKDLAVQIFLGKPFNLKEIMRQMLFVPGSMPANDLLRKMRIAGVHIAIVVDEYGGTDGLVTMEDVVEELVGEIQDEHDDAIEPKLFQWVNDYTIEADARMRMDELENCFGSESILQGSEEEFDTVGGLIFSYLGHIPAEGETFDYLAALRFTILQADARSIKRVRIERLQLDLLPNASASTV